MSGCQDRSNRDGDNSECVCWDGNSGFTCEQLQELKKMYFESDCNPKEEILEALAEALLGAGDCWVLCLSMVY